MNAPVEIDPITLEVVRNRLDGIANEMELTLLRSSFSPIVKEGLDASASLFTVAGETLAQAIAIPIHLATLMPCVRTILRTFPLETMAEDDVFLMNDPYLGGTHLPDIAIVMPAFCDGEIVALAATMTHHQDLGGMEPGSVPTTATEIFQEGLRLPPLKFHDRGRPDETIARILRLNVRIPDTFMGDLNAQIAACRVGCRRVATLAKPHGATPFRAMCDGLLDRSEAMTRTALRGIPEGTYRYVDYLDNDGIDLDTRIRIAVAVTVADGALHVDFDGTAAQVRGPLNVVPSGSLAAACYAVRAVTGTDIPTNGGCFRPISLALPEGSLVNPREPAPVNARAASIKRISGAILGALAEALPDRIPADNCGELIVTAMGGIRADGSRYVTGELIAGGSGAGPLRDGVDVIETDATNCMNLSAEALEMDAPVRVHRVGLRPDSGGAGARRGGLGTIRDYEILEGEIRFTHRGERHFRAPSGRSGGGAGAMARTLIHRADGTTEVVPSKLVTSLRAGDRLTIETAGGGGHGDPHDRPRETLSADIANGKVTAATAHLYGPARGSCCSRDGG